MAGKWPAWEQALRAAELWVANIPPATRGLKWDEPVAIEGDWTGATLEGTVSASPDAGVDLAEFSFTGPVVAEIAVTSVHAMIVQETTVLAKTVHVRIVHAKSVHAKSVHVKSAAVSTASALLRRMAIATKRSKSSQAKEASRYDWPLCIFEG